MNAYEKLYQLGHKILGLWNLGLIKPETCGTIDSEKAHKVFDELKEVLDSTHESIGNAAKLREALESLIFACDTFEQSLEYDLDGHYNIIPGYVDYAHDFATRVNSARAILKDMKGDAK